MTLDVRVGIKVRSRGWLISLYLEWAGIKFLTWREKQVYEIVSVKISVIDGQYLNLKWKIFPCYFSNTPVIKVTNTHGSNHLSRSLNP